MALIIQPIEITRNTPMGGNVDVDKYAYMIPEQQVFVLEPTLGTALIDKILQDITDNGIESLTGHYRKIVFDYCKPILWNSVFAEYLLFASMSVNNNGVFDVTPPDAQNTQETIISRRTNAIREKAQVYIDRLERYLEDKGHEIPEYQQAQPNNYDIDPVISSNIVGGFYLKDSPRIKLWYLDGSDR
jgi:hypothetical protein